MERAAQFCRPCRRHYDSERQLCPSCGSALHTPSYETPRYGSMVDDRYVRLETLGEGGMSVVVRAFDTTERREVALKVVRPRIAVTLEGVDRFFREVRVLKGLRHPNIVAPLGFGCTDTGLLYLVMERLVGDNLAHVLKTCGRFHPVRALSMALQAAEALATAHRARVLHRDLKPENFRLLPGDWLKMLDFGIAAPLADEAPAGEGTTKKVCGTPHYMSPERAMGCGEDERSDLYGLGVLLFELLTGHPPFSGATPMAIVRQHLVEPPPRLADLAPGPFPEALEELVQTLLRKEPSERPRTAEEVAETLRELRRGVRQEANAEMAAGLALPFHERPTLILDEDGDSRMTMPEVTAADSPTLELELPRDARPPSTDEVLSATFGGTTAPMDPRFATELAEKVPAEPKFALHPQARRIPAAVLHVEWSTDAEDFEPRSATALDAWRLATGSLGGQVLRDDDEETRIAFDRTCGLAPGKAASLAAATLWFVLERAGGRDELDGVRAAVVTGHVFVDHRDRSLTAWSLRGSGLDSASRMAATARPGTVSLCRKSYRSWRDLWISPEKGRKMRVRGRKAPLSLTTAATAHPGVVGSWWPQPSGTDAAESESPGPRALGLEGVELALAT